MSTSYLNDTSSKPKFLKGSSFKETPKGPTTINAKRVKRPAPFLSLLSNLMYIGIAVVLYHVVILYMAMPITSPALPFFSALWTGLWLSLIPVTIIGFSMLLGFLTCWFALRNK